ncbi:MAG: hypothetical protein ABSC37_13110 [Xanthobacteraceae bacterium]|jgi:hypothetical protein
MRKIGYANATSLLKVLSLMVATVAWGSSALAEGSSLPYGGGGPFAPFDAIISQYNQTGELFRIEGHCQSSCTMFLAIRNVCVDPNATLLFHAALLRRNRNQPPNPSANNHMLNAYNASLRDFLTANHYVDTFAFHAISGREIIHRFGYRECPKK